MDALPNSYAVIRKLGRNWNPSLTMQEQDEWDRHASFMNDLVATGFVKIGGPLDHGQEILLLVHAESEAAIKSRLDEDPWTAMGLLEIVSVKRWHILLGEGALPARSSLEQVETTDCQRARGTSGALEM